MVRENHGDVVAQLTTVDPDKDQTFTYVIAPDDFVDGMIAQVKQIFFK
jgi:hypothetical protein